MNKKYTYIGMSIVLLLIIFIWQSEDTKVNKKQSIIKKIQPKQVEIINDANISIIKVVKQEIKEVKKQVVLKKIKENNNTNIEQNNETIEIEDEEILENKPIILFSSNSKPNLYIVKILSDNIIKTLNNPQEYTIKYIGLRGVINENNKKYKFTLSLKEAYKDSFDANLQIQVISLRTNKAFLCDGYFLKNLDIDYSYNLTIDIYDDSISCYTSNERKIPDFIRNNEVKLNIEELPKELQDKIKQAIEVQNDNSK